MIDVRSPKDLLPNSPKGFAFATTSLRVIGTEVTGTVPFLAKFPERTIFWDLKSATDTSTCGLFKTLESLSVKVNLISSTVFPATSSIPAFG